MKKILAILSVVAVAGMAQADYLWNVNWAIGGAYSPDGLTPLQDDYSVTWSLVFSSGDTYSWSTLNGETGYGSMSYDEYLGADTPTAFLEVAPGAGDYTVQQIIEISGPSGDYYWESEAHPFQPTLDSTEPFPAALDLDVDVVIGSSDAVAGGNATAAWQVKATSVPEPATMSLLGLGALAMVLRRKLSK